MHQPQKNIGSTPNALYQYLTVDKGLKDVKIGGKKKLLTIKKAQDHLLDRKSDKQQPYPYAFYADQTWDVDQNIFEDKIKTVAKD